MTLPEFVIEILVTFQTTKHTNRRVGMLVKKNVSSESIVKSTSLETCVILGMSDHTRKGFPFPVIGNIIIGDLLLLQFININMNIKRRMTTLASKVQFLVVSVVLEQVLYYPVAMVAGGQSL